MLLYLAIGTSELTFQLFFKGIRIERYFATFRRTLEYAQ